MVNFKNGIMSLVMVVICFCVGCSSLEDKPSEDVMKSIITNIELNLTDQSKNLYKNIKYNKFTITKKFTPKENGRYCISVNYILVFNYHKDKFVTTYDRNDIKYCFKKRGEKWGGEKYFGQGE